MGDTRDRDDGRAERCSFCGRGEDEVRALVRSTRPSGEPACICSDCVRRYTRQLRGDDG